MKKILFHICCAPCFVAPYKHLNEKIDITGFWFNPNIHPYQEYHKRFMTLKQFTIDNNIKFIVKDEYNLENFLQKSTFREKNRCSFCYYDRLKYTAIVAKKGNFEGFSSTLLYSKYQKHEQIIEIADTISKEIKIPFYYKDLREYWQEGIEISKHLNMYRQQYCGCIYSEKERFHKQLEKLHA